MTDSKTKPEKPRDRLLIAASRIFPNISCSSLWLAFQPSALNTYLKNVRMSQNNRHELPPLARRRRVSVLSGLLSVLAIAVAGFYFQQSSAAPEAKSGSDRGKRGHDDHDTPAAVSIETAAQADFPIYLDGLGTVTALRTVTVQPRVDGEVIRIAFNEGQMVKEGELLAEIDPRVAERWIEP